MEKAAQGLNDGGDYPVAACVGGVHVRVGVGVGWGLCVCLCVYLFVCVCLCVCDCAWLDMAPGRMKAGTIHTTNPPPPDHTLKRCYFNFYDINKQK